MREAVREPLSRANGGRDGGSRNGEARSFVSGCGSSRDVRLEAEMRETGFANMGARQLDRVPRRVPPLGFRRVRGRTAAAGTHMGRRCWI